jgi:hypothetical protein
MFVLTEKRRYRWPVTVRVPGTGAGTIEEQRFIALFEAPRRDEAIVELEAIEKLPPIEREDAVLASLLARVVGWEEVTDATGTPVPFDPLTLRAAAQEPWFRHALDAAYRESLTGEAARLGN